MKSTYAFLFAGLAAQQAAATWNFFDKFNTPNYNTNECSDKQKSGFDWSDIKDGDKDFQYGDFDFSKGWSCSSSLGKRDHISKRTFGNKVVKNSCSKDKPASFGCGDKKKSGFSITDMDISVEFDVDLELHYTMVDGSKCKQYSSCSAGGTTLKNTQCGGATSVDIYMGSHYKGDKSQCEIGFHNIGFDCNPGTGYTPPTPPTISSTSVPVKSKSSATPPASSTSARCEGGSCNSETPSSSTPPSTPTGGSCEGGSCYSQSTPEAATTPIQTPPSDVPYSASAPYTNSSVPAYTSPPTAETSSAVAPPPSNETPVVSSSPAVVTPPAQESSTGVVPPPVQESSAVSAPCGYGESCTGTTVVPTSLSSTAIPQASSPSYPPASPPAVLPKCMNSWLQISTKCKDNTDKSCYCVNADFTKNVIDCVSSWCGTDDETRESLQYFIGICADYVPQNPKIIGDCPSYIPLNPTPATPTGGVTAGVSSAVSTKVPAGETPAPASTPCTTITYGSTSLTVPQVHFTTETGVAGATPTAPVALVPGTAPASTPATTTVAGGAPYPIPSTMGTKTAPAASGTGAVRPSSPAEFTGAASPFTVVPKHALIGAALAFLAL